MSLSLLVMGLLAPVALAAAASADSGVPTYTITSTTTSTIMSCPATVTVCENTCGATQTLFGGVQTGGLYAVNSPGFSTTTTVTVPVGASTTPAAGTPYVTHAVYSSALTCSGGETVIMSGTTSVVSSATVIEDCPCTKAVYVPATTATVKQAVGGGADASSAVVTQVVYPSAMTCSGGETITMGGVATVIESATTITDCPCTQATTVYVAGSTLAVGNAVGGSSYVTNVVYPSAMTCSGGETITMGGVATVIESATTITDCPCTQAKTVYVPGPTLAVGGSYVTNVVYPSSVTCTGGETVTITGNPTIIAGPTVITDCPCTLASTVVVPGPTLVIGGTTIGAGAATSATVVPSGTTSAPRSFETTVDGVTFLVQEEYNYEGVPLTLNTKRQTVDATLGICLKTCADALTCVGTSFNVESTTCLYFSAVLENSGAFDLTVEFATVVRRSGSSSSVSGTASRSSTSASGSSTSGTSSRTSATGTSASGTRTSTSGTSTSGTSTSGTSTSGTSTSGTSTSGTSTSASGTSTSGTSTSGTGTSTRSSTTADASSDPSSAPDADIVEREIVNLVAKATGLVLREANADKAGKVVRRGGILRRSHAEPASKKVRKAVIEL